MKKQKKQGKIEKALNNSFINYLSDLYVWAAVLLWIFVVLILIVASVYSMIINCDMSGWSYVTQLVEIPMTAGLGGWMIKNCVQHAIANSKGKQAHMDFPKVDVEDIESEPEMFKDDSESEDTQDIGSMEPREDTSDGESEDAE